jgi:hypothetical protein
VPEYFTLDELKALPDLEAARYDDETMERAAAYIEAVIERVVGTSFVPRTKTVTLNGTGADLVLPDAYVLSVVGVTVSEVAGADPTSFDNGVLTGTWASGTRNVVVEYTTGYSETPPADIKEAALEGTRARLLDTASNAKVNDRTTSTTNDVGGTTSYVLAGVDRPTGYPTVDAVILGWRDKLSGLGFA